ncbi:MAG: protein BatD [Candidatus Zixiibacteriota bacterium]|nr:MAG: protein BatD [candidate division Zixibacteria bacterium]
MTGSRVYISIIIFIFLSAVSAFGLSVSSSVDRNVVELGDPITLSITVTGERGSTPDPILPDLSNFEVYSSGKNTSISIVNGRFSSTLEMSYVLVPKKMGILTIGPVRVKEKNEIISSNPIRIEVKQPGKIGQSPGQKRDTESVTTPNRTENFFIEQVVDKRRPYVGEQVTLTFRFYQAENLWEQPTLEWPEFNGFTVEDLPPNNRYFRVINKKRYRVTEIRRALFPITAGDAIIDSPRLTIREDIFDTFMDPFNMFGRGRRRARPSGPEILTADRIKLTVRSLPVQGKPGNFAGAVGQYKIRAIVDKDSVGVDEPITMKVILSGSGNIKSLPAVSFPEMPDFRIYESGKTESINNSGGIVSGSMTFEQAVIPVTSGNFRIPSIEFSFFNPKTRKYQTVRTDPRDIIASGEALADIGGTPKNIIGIGQRSFAYIITDFPKPEKQLDIYKSAWFWILQFVPIAGMIAAVFMRLHNRKLMGDQAYARRMSAGKKSRSLLKSALRKKQSGDVIGFYGELYSAIIGHIADRLNLEKSALTIDDIKAIEKLDSETRSELVGFLDGIQVARFAPGPNSASGMDRAAGDASGLLKRLEKKL